MVEKSERAQKEEGILNFWQENQIFEKTLEKESPEGEFVFFDGPPFATGLPHAGSLLSSVIKDVIPRYKTMRGYHVRRRWGWDCHGLPIENMIEKELGIKDKTEIESKVGVREFNETCRASVLRYAHEWKKYVDRVGRWVEYDNAYKTMDNSYIESVWQALKKINEKGLLYEGRKVLLYCPHCQTPIAKAEIAMDNSYKDVTEESVYAKFRLKDSPNAYFLAWTTTPWTLPGNVALAVGAEVDYVEAKVGEEILVLAKERLSVLSEPYEVLAEHKGREMVGMEYEPLFEIGAVKDSGKKAFYVAEADFVTTEEGTGIVHTAVIYGEDDYNLGLRLDLPMVPLLDEKAHFNNSAPEFIRGQYFKKAERVIKEDLERRGLMFKKENHTHSYPHCHRCGTALLYNAISSWFINIQKVKERMISLNEKVNWVPEHLKHGRFLNIVENAPDWTISRNRYWAAPLPIWKDAEGNTRIVGSLEELKKLTKNNGNTFIVMRHGETPATIERVWDINQQESRPLTDNGITQAKESARNLPKIDVIITSPHARTKETAETVAEELGIPKNSILVDEQLTEWYVGSEFNTRSIESYFDERRKSDDRHHFKAKGGESYADVVRRSGKFLYETDKKYQGKTILVVTHGAVITALSAIAEGLPYFDAVTKERTKERNGNVLGLAETYRLNYCPLPHNANFELDLHRPYIDEIELVSEDGKPLKRIPEVIDGWVESASMPFAEYHYPFENKKEFEKRFPGDFVAEYIAQTRTWFYYMHAIATILFDDLSFKNVITTGNVLAHDGSKMSKSKGNYTDPLTLIDRVGADAFRYYLMSSVVMQAEDMLFKDEEVKEVHNRLLNILSNSFTFYEMYAGEQLPTDDSKPTTEHVLDKWIVARLNQLIEEVTEGLENYDTVKATRPIRDFVTDLSTWYVRRSRERFKGENEEDRKQALNTTRYVFRELSKIIAPTMPFIAEEIYQKVRGESDPLSVHLELWPEVRSQGLLSMITGKDKGEEIIKNMEATRRLVTLALEQRQKANIKVRQPLRELRIKESKLAQEYLEILRDELNVKIVTVDENLSEEMSLDTALTPELIEEGKMRDVIRSVQEWRKEQNLKPGEKARYEVPEGDREIFEKFAEEIKKVTNVEF